MFYKPNNKIIIVDDVQDDLDRLGKEFFDNGVGCKTFLYDLGFNAPLQGVRIAFFDIEINPSGGGSESQKFNSLATAIKQYIHSDNGPFALIFWTKNVEDIDKLKDYITKVHQDCPRPFLVSQIDKADFSENSQEKLQTILSDETLELLFDFENKASEAASDTIGQVYNIIPNNDSWGSNSEFKVNFEKIFSKISTSSIGFEHAKRNPDKAVYEALIPVLNYSIVKQNRSTKWASYLSSLKSATSISDFAIPHFKYGLLNSIFHLDTTSDIDYTQRGAVFEFNYQFEPDNADRFNYMEKLYEKSIEIFSRFVVFNNDTTSSEERDFFRGHSKFVIIEISAACDYSQNKLRNHKFVLGLLTPAIDRSKIKFGDISESVFFKDIPVLHYKSDDYRLWINFNFSFSDFEINKNIGNPLFILKKEIMDMVGNRYANHVSRIGITSF